MANMPKLNLERFQELTGIDPARIKDGPTWCGGYLHAELIIPMTHDEAASILAPTPEPKPFAGTAMGQTGHQLFTDARHQAAEHYGTQCVDITITNQQQVGAPFRLWNGEKLIACGSNYPVFKADYTAVIKHEHKEFGRIYPECVNCGEDQQ